MNILPEFLYKKYNLAKLEEVPFQLKMADQRRIQPLDILQKQEVCVAGMSFQVNFVVIRMEENDSPYPMLLGRPWFTQAKLKMDWGKCRITIRRGKKKIRLHMVPTTLIPVHARALHAEPISATNNIEDDEEEAFLQANESVVPV